MKRRNFLASLIAIPAAIKAGLSATNEKDLFDYKPLKSVEQESIENRTGLDRWFMSKTEVEQLRAQFIKKQHFILHSKPQGYAFNWDALKEIADVENCHPEEILKALISQPVNFLHTV